MDSLLNHNRPPVFCPGCAHDRVVTALDNALTEMGLAGNQIVIVSDIGCSGLFDTFFNTHAMHGLHGRALTYATGIKMARPELTVIVTMGDGGLGIGGAHLLSSCRRNLDLTLLVLNNFNYGMTGGQFSSTTPMDARVGSGFLNKLEKPSDVCQVAGAAGAAQVERASAYDKKLAGRIKTSIGFKGFSLMDIRGVCPGRFTKSNKLNPALIKKDIDKLPALEHFKSINARKEYGSHYLAESEKLDAVKGPAKIIARCEPVEKGPMAISILGGAGQRIGTAGELVCLAGAAAGLNATQKNDYPITVLRGHSISELILSHKKIGFTGITDAGPSVVLALSEEGIGRRHKMLNTLSRSALVIKPKGLDLPTGNALVQEINFKAHKIKNQDQALAMLSILAKQNRVLSMEMLLAAIHIRFSGKPLSLSLDMANRIAKNVTPDTVLD